MLTKAIKITIYNNEGKGVDIKQIDGLQRRADGCFTSDSSRILARGIIEVEEGGAMFVERAWSK